MKTSDLLLAIFIILIFVGLYLINILGIGIKNIEQNWQIYRCNPLVMPFAGIFNQNPSTNFSYCIQNIQKDFMKILMQPVDFNLSVLGNIGSDVTSGIQKIREFFDYIRGSITHIIQLIMDIFMNLIIQIQKQAIHIKDSFGKIIGILTSFMFILDGSIMTMEATWKGPPGGLMRSLCFHPNTLIKTSEGTIIKIKDVLSGTKLKNGQIVYATMDIHNLDENNNFVEDLYSIPNGEKNKSILVSGSHLIYDKNIQDFVHVKNFSSSVKSNITSKKLICLITSDHTIPLGTHIFHDWEDNNGSPSKN